MRRWCWKSRPACACLAAVRLCYRLCCTTRMRRPRSHPRHGWRRAAQPWWRWRVCNCHRCHVCRSMPCPCTRWPQRLRICQRWRGWVCMTGAACGRCRVAVWRGALVRLCWTRWIAPTANAPSATPGSPCPRCLTRRWNSPPRSMPHPLCCLARAACWRSWVFGCVCASAGPWRWTCSGSSTPGAAMPPIPMPTTTAMAGGVCSCAPPRPARTYATGSACSPSNWPVCRCLRRFCICACARLPRNHCKARAAASYLTRSARAIRCTRCWSG